MGAFRYDNPLMAIFVRVANLMLVSLYWVLCCLPVVTIIPASAALYHTVCKVVRGTGNGVSRDFFRTFVRELKTGSLLSLFILAAGILIGYGLFLGGQLWSESIFGIVYIAIGALLICILGPAILYIAPTLSRFEGGISMILRLSLYFASQHLLRNFFMILLLGLMVLLVDFYPVLLLLLPGIYVDLICTGMEKTLSKYAGDNGLDGDEQEETAVSSEDPADMGSIALDRLLTAEEEGAAK